MKKNVCVCVCVCVCVYIYIYIYIYIYTNYFAVQQKLTQHCKSTTLQYNKLKKKKRNTTARSWQSSCVLKTPFYSWITGKFGVPKEGSWSSAGDPLGTWGCGCLPSGLTALPHNSAFLPRTWKIFMHTYLSLWSSVSTPPLNISLFCASKNLRIDH